MGAKTKIFITADSTIAAATTNTQETSVPPGGLGLFIVRFGYADPVDAGLGGIIALQWGSGASWQTVRVGTSGSGEYLINTQLPTDGTKRLRLVRQNRGVTAKPMAAWLEAYLEDG